LPNFIPPYEEEERYWVVKHNIRNPSFEHSDYENNRSASDQLIISMYFMLTTLSTIGYGDLYPYSITEKIFGAIIQIMGVTLFSIVMNAVIDIIRSSLKGGFSNEEDL
jgi:uncharacterized membrane protein